MKITQVEPQKKNSRRYNVYLDGQFAFGADEDLVVDRRLIAGKEVDKEELEKIMFGAEVGKLMERMYGLFNIRQRSEKEIRDYLRNLSFKKKIKDQDPVSDLAVEHLIERMKQKGLVNDEMFARSWVEARSKKKGINLVKSELYKKGISREIIEEVTGDQGSGDKEGEVAEKLLGKRLERLSSLPETQKKQKALEFLMRRGFEYSLAKEVVEKVLEKDYTNS